MSFYPIINWILSTLLMAIIIINESSFCKDLGIIFTDSHHGESITSPLVCCLEYSRIQTLHIQTNKSLNISLWIVVLLFSVETLLILLKDIELIEDVLLHSFYLTIYQTTDPV